MSEPTVEAPAAPASTADIAASVVTQMESSTPESATPDTATPIPSPSETPAITAPELSPAAKFLVSKGHKVGKRENGKTDLTWLPFTSVETMLKEYHEGQASAWDGERTTLSEQLKEYREAVEGYRAAIQGDPRAFLSEIANGDPRYKAFLDSQAQPAPAPPPLTLPEPDAEWNGARTWSMEAFQTSIIPYIVQEAKKEAKAEAEAMLKPLREREEREQVQSAIVKRTRETMAEAQTWPGWSDHEAEILQALKEDSAKAQAEKRRPTLTLEAAYRQVVFPKLSADRTKMREEILKELDGAAKASPSLSRAGAESLSKPGPADTRSIAAKVLAQMEKGA